MRTGILEPDGFSKQALKRLQELGPVTFFDGQPRDLFLGDLEALFVRLGSFIDAEFLAAAPQLRFLVSPTTGHTHIDMEEIARREIKLISLAGERTFLNQIRATPEHTLGLILALLRNYRTAFVSETNPNWDRDLCRGEEVADANIGLIGFGRVGQILARYLTAMEANIHWIDPSPVVGTEVGTRHTQMQDLIDTSQIVVMCASYCPGAGPILDASLLQRLRGKYFVNTARGELVDEVALKELVINRQLAGVALDVISGEQTTADRNSWEQLANEHLELIITPHVAGATWRSMRLTEEFVTDKLISFAGEVE